MRWGNQGAAPPPPSSASLALRAQSPACWEALGSLGQERRTQRTTHCQLPGPVCPRTACTPLHSKQFGPWAFWHSPDSPLSMPCSQLCTQSIRFEGDTTESLGEPPLSMGVRIYAPDGRQQPWPRDTKCHHHEVRGGEETGEAVMLSSFPER